MVDKAVPVGSQSFSLPMGDRLKIAFRIMRVIVRVVRYLILWLISLTRKPQDDS